MIIENPNEPKVYGATPNPVITPATDPNYIPPTYAPEGPAAPAKPKKKGNKVLIGCLIAALVAGVLAVFGIVAVVLIGILIAMSAETPEAKLETAYNDYCSYYSATLAGDNSYLSIDTNVYDLDDYFDSSAWSDIQDVNDYLDIPDYVEDQMLETSALDGLQTYYGEDYWVSWTYHPDEGLEVTYNVY